MIENQEEMKCPKCNSDMKEYITSFKCRNMSCGYVFKNYFHTTSQPVTLSKEKLKITLKPWYYECADHCCSDYGSHVTINDILVTDNGDQEHILLQSVLNHLGYEVEIIGLNKDGEESWRA